MPDGWKLLSLVILAIFWSFLSPTLSLSVLSRITINHWQFVMSSLSPLFCRLLQCDHYYVPFSSYYYSYVHSARLLLLLPFHCFLRNIAKYKTHTNRHRHRNTYQSCKYTHTHTHSLKQISILSTGVWSLLLFLLFSFLPSSLGSFLLGCICLAPLASCLETVEKLIS